MSEIKKFLRFEISGYIVILYVVLYSIAFLDMNKINITLAEDILSLSVSGFIIAAPIGYLMHQIDISLFSPFKEERLGKKRKAILLLKDYIKDYHIFRTIKPQMSLEIIKCLSDEKIKFNYSYFEKEISNRYSYYYSRIEAGIFSPIFGFLIFIIIVGFLYFNFGNPIIDINLKESAFLLRILFIIYILLAIFIISFLIYNYCKNLLEEIDELEYLFIQKNKYRILNEFEDEN